MENSVKTSRLTRWWRLFRLLLWTVELIWVCRVHYPFLSQARRDRRTCQLAQRAMRILHVHTEMTGTPRADITHTLFVANHVSWLDAFALLGQYPMSFVAKKEIRSWFLLGKVVAAAGNLFIDRTQRHDSGNLSRLMADNLRQGCNTAFFPEARTSEDGLHVRPFKAALFESAVLSASDIQPVVIRFYDGNGHRTALPAYTDSVSLLGSVRNILSLREMVVRLDFLACIPAASVVTSDRFALKDRVEAVVTAVAEADIATAADW